MGDALVMRPWLAVFALLAVTAAPLGAQLRPYEPAPWNAWDRGESVSLSIGVRHLLDQQAALAGVRGSLTEVVLWEATVAVDRVQIRALGAPYRRLAIDQVFAEPAPGTDPIQSDGLTGVGDFSIETLVPLWERGSHMAILRFGTRLPTTDNRIGLERDRIDFHALAGARTQLRSVRLSGELGVGIHGTREAEYEQSDVLIYLFGAEWSGPLAVGAQLVGHADGLPDRSIRGNEELSELRFWVAGRGRFAPRVEAIAGLTAASPSFGVGLWLDTGF